MLQGRQVLGLGRQLQHRQLGHDRTGFLLPPAELDRAAVRQMPHQ
jgi:hypothetical protein